MTSPTIANSGDGTRPTTSGGVDNIGAGSGFSGKRNAVGEEVSSPAPREQMQKKRMDVESTKQDDSSAFDLREHLKQTPGSDPHKT